MLFNVLFIFNVVLCVLLKKFSSSIKIPLFEILVLPRELVTPEFSWQIFFPYFSPDERNFPGGFAEISKSNS
jgi:hypothetical protein